MLVSVFDFKRGGEKTEVRNSNKLEIFRFFMKISKNLVKFSYDLTIKMS